MVCARVLAAFYSLRASRISATIYCYENTRGQRIRTASARALADFDLRIPQHKVVRGIFDVVGITLGAFRRGGNRTSRGHDAKVRRLFLGLSRQLPAGCLEGNDLQRPHKSESGPLHGRSALDLVNIDGIILNVGYFVCAGLRASSRFGTF